MPSDKHLPPDFEQQQNIAREEILRQVERLIPLIKWLIGGAFALGIWAASLEARARVYGDKIEVNGRVLEDVKMWRASTQGHLLTSGDFTREREILNEQARTLERRITTLEAKMDTVATHTSNAALNSQRTAELLQKFLDQQEKKQQ